MRSESLPSEKPSLSPSSRPITPIIKTKVEEVQPCQISQVKEEEEDTLAAELFELKSEKVLARL